MIYLSLWKKLTMEKNKTLNFQHQNSVVLVKVMDLNQVIRPIDAHTVEVMEE